MAGSTGEGSVFISTKDIVKILESNAIFLPAESEIVAKMEMDEGGEHVLHFAWDNTDEHPCNWMIPPKFFDVS